jgi:hypothetical protein
MSFAEVMGANSNNSNKGTWKMMTQGSVDVRQARQQESLLRLTQVIKPELVAQVLSACQKNQTRRANLDFETTLWIVLAMGIFTDLPIRDVCRFTCTKPSMRLPGRSALCRARKRLGAEPLRQLHAEVVQRLGKSESDGSFYKNHRLVGIDGCLFNTPDTPANECAFGRPRGGHTKDSQGAYPQVGKMSLVELGTHVELAFHLRAHWQGEQTIAYRITKHLQPGDLLLMDAGIFCFRMAKQTKTQKAEFLARSQIRTLEPIKKLADGSYLAQIYSHNNHRRRGQNGMVVRVINYTLNEPSRAGHQKPRRLITSLLDDTEHPACELVALYHERWEQELLFDEQKTHQDPRRPHKPTHLRSQTPAGVVQELYSLSLAHFVVRKVMVEAAQTINTDVDRISFSGAIRIIRCRLSEITHQQPTTWYSQLIAEVAREILDARRNRINPRVLRQSRSKWKSKKKHHYQLPKLSQPFKNSVVIIM